MTLAVIIAAAGAGRRLGRAEPKAFVKLGGKPLILWSLERFRRLPQRQATIVVVPPGWQSAAEVFTEESEFVLAGGPSRAESVRRALRALPPGIELVAVHDAARPLVAPEDIERTIEAAGDGRGAVLGRPVVDSLKRACEGKILAEVDRRDLWHAETPQVFPAGVLVEAYDRVEPEPEADDSRIAKSAGFEEIVLVQAGWWNPKITFPKDLLAAEELIGERRP